MEIIGNKEKFAIEYNTSSKPNVGNVRIWTRNKYIGTIEDNIFLDSFINSFDRIEDLSDNNFVKKNIKSGFEINSKLFLSTSKISGLIGLPENFDDFITRIFEFNNNIYFFWQLVEKPYFQYADYNNKDAFFSIVQKSILADVLSEFKRVLIDVSDYPV